MRHLKNLNPSTIWSLSHKLSTNYITIIVSILVASIEPRSGDDAKANANSKSALISKSPDYLEAKYFKVQNEGTHLEIVRPTISIGILIRNKAHSLPYFLGHIEALDYPKERIRLYIRAEDCIDDSIKITQQWLANVSHEYHGVDFKFSESKEISDPRWTNSHYDRIIQLRQDALNAAKNDWADFHFSIDADVILLNPATLKILIETVLSPPKETIKSGGITVLAPLLNCSTGEFFSNFWGDMTAEGYYKRSDNYFEIQQRHTLGIFPVAMVHTAFLVNLRHTFAKKLAYYPPLDYRGPIDDLILFARSAQATGVKFYVDNRHFYGYFPMPVDEEELDDSVLNSTQDWLKREDEKFVHLKTQAKVNDDLDFEVVPAPSLNTPEFLSIPKASKLGFDEVYLINLERRPDRLAKMLYNLRELGIDARLMKAVDGNQLTNDKLKAMNISQLEGYKDPYHKRPIKFGEIGCFLSHYTIWEDMILNDYERVLILEDDIRFVPGFIRRMHETVSEADLHKPDWELLYIGRKRMSRNEIRVPGTRLLAYPSYTYWTLSYILQRKGTVKLLAQNPLQKIIAVDEFLPIMFDKHPNKRWLEAFGPRDLSTISAEPLLVEPIYYAGEPNYVSDTEDSAVILDPDIEKITQ